MLSNYTGLSVTIGTLRPPNQVKMTYQLPPIQCCFIAIYICIEPSQIYGPVPGQESFMSHAVTDRRDQTDIGP